MKKIAVIGLGSIGKRHLANIKTMIPNVMTFGVSSSGEQPDKELENVDKIFLNIELMLAFKPDMAIVASPATFHAEHAIKLINAGIPILIEKPVTASLNDAELLLETLKKSPIAVSVGYCLRHMPSASVVKKMLDEKILGEIYNVSSTFGQYLPGWRKDKDFRHSVSVSKQLGGGVLLELSHELDYLAWFLGELNIQYAHLRNTKELDLEVEEIADIILTTLTGTVCYLHLDFLQKQAQRTCSFIGKKGRIEWDLLSNSVVLFNEQGTSTIYSDPLWDKNQMYILMLDDFMKAIQGHSNHGVSVEEAINTIELIETIKSQCLRCTL